VSLSLQSGHPLSRGILRKYGDLQANVKPVEACSEIPGKGITGLVDGIPWWVGSRNWLEEAGFLRTAAQEHFIRRREKAGDTLVCLGHKGQLDAVLAFNDVLRPSAPAAVVALQQAGIRVVILSGDHAGSVGRVAEALGISEWRGEQTPQGKADYIRQRQASGEKVGMAGDGINDAPALAVADLSIAMSSGAGVAMDVADITLMNNDLLQIQQAIRLSAMTTKTIRQNLFWAFAYNGAAVPLAAGVLYPLYGITLNPAIAGAAMALSSLTVVLNSLRLRQQKL
jgi:Cu2+-exporting ATPase